MKIGFLGLGAMGLRMATRLIAAGHQVTVWNRTARRIPPGADGAGTPRAAVVGADVVIAMVRDDAASAAVWTDPDTGAFAGMARGATAIDCATLSPGHMRGLHQLARRMQLRFVEAPLAGSRPQAEAGLLIFFAGGDPADVAHVEPILLDMGATVHNVGGPGAGAAIKLMVNTLFAAQVAVVAEILSLAKLEGLDPVRAWDVVGATPVASPAAKAAGAAMLARAFAPAFPIDLVVKDLTLAATALCQPMTQATLAVFQEATDQGHAAENITAVVKTRLP